MSATSTAIGHLGPRREAMLDAIRALVEVNSYTENKEGGARVGAMLADTAASIPGVFVRKIPSPSGKFADHWLFGTAAAQGTSEGAIAVVGHLDTVFPPGTFEGFRRDETLAYGPGVLDMKGGLVAAFEAISAVAHAGALADLPILFAVVSDEEVGSPEGRPILQQALSGASAALVLEAGRKGDAIITARKGTAGVRARAKGRAAHAGNAHKEGANAIWALAKFVDGAQGLTRYEQGITVNVGKISGGQSKNTVPDGAEAAFDFRFERVTDGEAVMARFQELAAASAAAVPGTEIALEGGIARIPLERSEANLALLREYGACAAAAGLGCGESPLVGGGSDASSTSQIGIASIDGLGPRGTGFHTKEERIEIASLVPKAEALARFFLGRRR